jgi:hypothetical protein
MAGVDMRLTSGGVGKCTIAYSPDDRDHAQRARGALLNAVLTAPGAAGWKAKLELASDPLFEDLKDRAVAIARERAAEEAEGPAFTEAEVVALDTYGEAPPATRDAMFAIMRDRPPGGYRRSPAAGRFAKGSMGQYYQRASHASGAGTRAAQPRQPHVHRRPGGRDRRRKRDRHKVAGHAVTTAGDNRTEDRRKAPFSRGLAQGTERPTVEKVHGSGQLSCWPGRDHSFGQDVDAS